MFYSADHLQLPNLKTVNILLDNGPHIVDKKWHPWAIDQFFGGHSVVVVDLLDPAAVARVKQHLQAASVQSSWRPSGSLQAETPTTNPIMKRFKMSLELSTGPRWQELAEIVQQDFVVHRWQRSPVTFDLTEVYMPQMASPVSDQPVARSLNRNNDWVRQTLESVQFRPVHVFALLDGRMQRSQFLIDD